MKALLHHLNTLEAPICRAASQHGEHLGTQQFFGIVSRLGDGIFWYLIMLLLPAFYGKAGIYVAAQMLFVGIVSLVIYKVLKRWTLRLRPCDEFPDIRRHAPMLDNYSFPSGHTMHAVGFNAVLLSHFPQFGIVIAPVSLLIASSRLVLGLHYPSDVAAGAAIGGLVAWSSFLIIG